MASPSAQQPPPEQEQEYPGWTAEMDPGPAMPSQPRPARPS